MSAYTVGQEIGYARFHHFNNTILSGGISKIKKINRWGHVELDNGMVFDKRNQQRNTLYGHCLISVDRYRVYRAEELDRRNRNSALMEARMLLNTFRVDYASLDAGSKAQLKQLIDQL